MYKKELQEKKDLLAEKCRRMKKQLRELLKKVKEPQGICWGGIQKVYMGYYICHLPTDTVSVCYITNDTFTKFSSLRMFAADHKL